MVSADPLNTSLVELVTKTGSFLWQGSEYQLHPTCEPSPASFRQTDICQKKRMFLNFSFCFQPCFIPYIPPDRKQFFLWGRSSWIK